MALIGSRDGRKTRILGELENAIADAASAPERLIAAAELHHAFSFDEVRDCDKRLDYEPRCSVSCPRCGSIWVGSKAGEILRLGLGASRLERAKTTIEGGIRTLVHVHRLGQIIAGLDIGYVLAFDATGLALQGHCHPARALARAQGPRLPYESGSELSDDSRPERFMHGITAMLELPAEGGDPIDIVVATRAPELFVVRLEQGGLTIRARHALPGWSRSLTVTGRPGDEALICVTRSGEFLEWQCRELRDAPRAGPVRTDRTNLLPTAVARPAGSQAGDGHALFVGANDGLYLRRSRDAKPVHVAVTRSSVQSIATVTIPADREGGSPRSYAALGLEDGRLRVIEERALFAWLDGHDAPGAHDFRVNLGDAVLGLEILVTDEPDSPFVLAALRDHRLRLFHVRSRETLMRELWGVWREVIGDPDAITRSELDAQLAGEHRLRGDAGASHQDALRYLLVDEVLPRWTETLDGCDPRVVQRACEVTRGAGDKVLYRLSATMGKIADGDASALIRISRACLVAMPERDPQRWRAFVSYHLKRFHECTSRPALRDDVPRLQHWSRFVRKYLLLGETFADKRFGITSLVARNKATHKHLDALIYATQLEQQRYDLKWSRVARRDKHGRAQEIARVEIIDNVAIVITAAAEIVFFDLEGEPLPIYCDGRARDCLSPERGALVSGVIRTRVARVTRKHGSWVRIALSWAGGVKSDRPRLTMFDVRFAGRCVELDGVHAVTSRLPARADGAEVEVHGLFGLPGADAFLAGLDSSESPLALLTQRPGPGSGPEAARGWVLSELAPGEGSRDGLPEVLSTPVRAVAAFELETPGCYLAAAGAADGSLRFTAFDLAGHIVAVDAGPTLLVHSINDIALAVRRDDDEYDYVCYAGTETGESLCLLVRVDLPARTIVTKQLWRDLHDSPVIAVRPTKQPDQPGARVLYDKEVVFIVTRDGHIAIHHAARGDPGTVEVTASNNYYFEGMRFDRINLPAGLTSWASPRGRSGFLAAYPNGELQYGELHAPRESRPHAAMKRDTRQLYQDVMHAQLFHGAGASEQQKLEICAMVRIGGGALRSYVLRKQLEELPWSALGVDEIEALLDEHLAGLSAEVAEERNRIKLVVKMVSSKVLDRHPDEILEDCRPGKAYDRIAAYPRVWRTCRYLSRYLLDAAVQAQPGAVRVRMSIVHALLRANVLWHAALDEQSARHIPLALRDVLTACLRDEDRIVCVEALRAVAVVLRNVSMLLARARDEDRELTRTSFFPLGLKTLQWLVSTILENFARYRRYGQPVLLSTPWSYITVLVLVIRLFPADALGVCEQISRRGLGDSLETIVDRLRGRRVRGLRARIRALWIMPLLRQRAHAQARAEFIAAFDDCNIGRMLVDYDLAPGDADHPRASGLVHIYRRLALLWNVVDDAGIAAIPVRCARGGDLPELAGSLAAMPRILRMFVQIARAGRDEQVGRLAELRAAIASELRDGQEPPEAVRIVLERVVEYWQSVLEPKIPTTGEKLAGHTLGRILMERDNGIVYTVGDRTRVIKVLRNRDTKARDEFNRDARLSRELADRYPSFVRVHRLEPSSGYVEMERAEVAVARESRKLLDAGDASRRARIARVAAVQLARALRCLHVEGLAHGDLRAENVFVSPGGELPTFRLGDLHVGDDGSLRSTGALLIPSFLRAAVPAGVEARVWIDLISLALFLHWVLTARRLEPDTDPAALARVVAGLAGGRDVVARVVARMLGANPCTTAGEIEDAVASDLPEVVLAEFSHKPLAGRVLAKFDVFLSYDSEDISVASELYTELTRRGLVPYLDQRELVPDNWWPVIAHAMDQSRAFAIIVGEQYRDEGYQAKEVGVARSEARKDHLPFKVFLLGARPPAFTDREVIPVGRDAKAMADHIVRSFEHPIEPPGR